MKIREETQKELLEVYKKHMQILVTEKVQSLEGVNAVRGERARVPLRRKRRSCAWSSRCRPRGWLMRCGR